MSFESFEDIISFAADKEKEAVAFYEDLAGQAPHTGGRDILQGFAKEEKKHQDMLENFGKNKKKLEDYKFKWVPDLKRSDYLADVEYDTGMGFPELLRLAMKREEASLKLYNQLLSELDADEFIRVFKMLAQEEASHKYKLEIMYDDYMTSQGD